MQIDHNDNRTSKHFNAIAEINFEMYKYLVKQIEDEEHAIYNCVLYDRLQYRDIFTRYSTVKDFLHPINTNDAYRIGSFLLQIETQYEKIIA